MNERAHQRVDTLSSVEQFLPNYEAIRLGQLLLPKLLTKIELKLNILAHKSNGKIIKNDQKLKFFLELIDLNCFRSILNK